MASKIHKILLAAAILQLLASVINFIDALLK